MLEWWSTYKKCYSLIGNISERKETFFFFNIHIALAKKQMAISLVIYPFGLHPVLYHFHLFVFFLFFILYNGTSNIISFLCHCLVATFLQNSISGVLGEYWVRPLSFEQFLKIYFEGFCKSSRLKFSGNLRFVIVHLVEIYFYILRAFVYRFSLGLCCGCFN